jgi:hypothetical protein
LNLEADGGFGLGYVIILKPGHFPTNRVKT